MVKSFHLKICIPTRTRFDEDIHQVDICTSEGWCGVLSDHAPFIGTLVPNFVVIHKLDGTTTIGVINYGIVTVKKNNVVLISDFFEFVDNLSETEAAINERNAIIAKAMKEIQLDEKGLSIVEKYVNLISTKIARIPKEKK